MKCPLVIIPSIEQSIIDFLQFVYEDILSNFYFIHNQPNQCTLMEDGALIYHSRYPNNWKQAHGIKKINWLPNLPDFNLIENLWKIIKGLLKHHRRLKSKEEMIQIIQEVWTQVS